MVWGTVTGIAICYYYQVRSLQRYTMLLRGLYRRPCQLFLTGTLLDVKEGMS